MTETPAASGFWVRNGWIPVLGLLLAGLWIGFRTEWEPLLDTLLHWTPGIWVAPVLVVAQALCFALALPGSVSFVVIGLLYDPLPATAMIVTGGVTGSTAGYYLSRHMAHTWSRNVQHRSLYRLLQRNSNFLMLCAMRILPGFPHSILNFGSGLLRIPIGRFISSAVLGYIAKGLLYSIILGNVKEAKVMETPMTIETLWPMALLGALFIAGFVIQKLWLRHSRLNGNGQ